MPDLQEFNDSPGVRAFEARRAAAVAGVGGWTEGDGPEPYVCPKCGADEWKVFYATAVVQDVRLTLKDGQPVPYDWPSAYEGVGDGDMDDEQYRCRACDYTLDLGRPVFEREGERLISARAIMRVVCTNTASSPPLPTPCPDIPVHGRPMRLFDLFMAGDDDTKRVIADMSCKPCGLIFSALHEWGSLTGGEWDAAAGS